MMRFKFWYIQKQAEKVLEHVLACLWKPFKSSYKGVFGLPWQRNSGKCGVRSTYNEAVFWLGYDQSQICFCLHFRGNTCYFLESVPVSDIYI